MKRGQAAMEFLMTYGWAILAAIIVVGVLAYFGVFGPGKYVTGSAILEGPFYIEAWNLHQDAIAVELRNNGGEDITVTHFNVAAQDGTLVCTSAIAQPILHGEASIISVPCTGLPSVGEPFRGDIELTYRKPNSELDLPITGTVAGTVTATE